MKHRSIGWTPRKIHKACLLFVGMLSFFLCKEAYGGAKNYYIPWNEGKLKDVLPFCQNQNQLHPLKTPYDFDERCLSALRVAIPFGESFSSSKNAIEHREQLVRLFAWLLAMEPLTLPADLRVLRHPKLQISPRYLCIFHPELRKEECGFQAELEPSYEPTLNQRLLNHLITQVKEFVEHPNPLFGSAGVTVLARAYAPLGRGKGVLHLYPKFWKISRIRQIGVLLHETEHFHLETGAHFGYCPEEAGIKFPASLVPLCDQGPFTGPFGSDLVVTELFLQAKLREVEKEKQLIRLGPFMKETYYPMQKIFDIVDNYCSALLGQNALKLMPQDFQSVCKNPKMYLAIWMKIPYFPHPNSLGALGKEERNTIHSPLDSKMMISGSSFYEFLPEKWLFAPTHYRLIRNHPELFGAP